MNFPIIDLTNCRSTFFIPMVYMIIALDMTDKTENRNTPTMFCIMKILSMYETIIAHNPVYMTGRNTLVVILFTKDKPVFFCRIDNRMKIRNISSKIIT